MRLLEANIDRVVAAVESSSKVSEVDRDQERLHKHTTDRDNESGANSVERIHWQRSPLTRALDPTSTEVDAHSHARGYKQSRALKRRTTEIQTNHDSHPDCVPDGLSEQPDGSESDPNRLKPVNAKVMHVEVESRSVDLRLEEMNRTLALVAGAVGVHNMKIDKGDDRRRLKEKLKAAMESGSRLSVRQIDSEREMWMEYVFGICKPDGRVGKSGSR